MDGFALLFQADIQMNEQKDNVGCIDSVYLTHTQARIQSKFQNDG